MCSKSRARSVMFLFRYRPNRILTDARATRERELNCSEDLRVRTFGAASEEDLAERTFARFARLPLTLPISA